MRVAVIDESGAVVNVIVADPEKDSIPGHRLVAIPDGEPVDARWVWSEKEGFKPGEQLKAAMLAERLQWNDAARRFDPTPEYEAEMRAEAISRGGKDVKGGRDG